MRNNDFGDADYFSTDFNIEFIIIFLINLFIIYLFTDIAGVFRRDGSMNKNRLHLGFVTFLFSLLFSLCLSYFLLFLIISLSIIWICMLVDKRSIHLHSFFGGGLFRAVHAAGGLIRATVAGLCHCHSKLGSKLILRPTPQLWQCQILNPLSKARVWTCILMDTSQVRYCWAMTELFIPEFNGLK